MKKLDSMILDAFYWFSNRMYRTYSVDNYTFGTLSFVLAVLASTMIGVAIYQTDFHDINPAMAAARKQSAIFFPMCFAGISITALMYRKSFRDFLSLRSDTEKTPGFGHTVALAIRWVLTGFFLLSLVLAAFGGMMWWSLWDLFFIAIGIWFYSTKPPDMNLRMNKWVNSDHIG